MRLVLIACGVLVAATALSAQPASAGEYFLWQNGPWCANYSAAGGFTNCNFYTFEQCLESVRGVGGFCVRNTMYVPREDEPHGRRHRHRREW